MTEIKKPKWDDCPNRGIIGENVSFSDIGEQLKKGMTITAKYKGKNINMKITAETSPGVFNATIFDIEQNAATYEGIAINDIVEIKREAICWHHK